jgi:hydroxymethylbilane synthase
MKLVFATRPSALARWQTTYVINLLKAAHPELECDERIIATSGDRIVDRPLPEIGGKGLFTGELEAALRSGDADIAVHSLKDLPVEDSHGIVTAAIPVREAAFDVLLSNSGTLDQLPPAARVGTCSVRRTAQLLARRPDLTILPLRGNVDTRLRKLKGGDYDAIVLAYAGIKRLGLDANITESFSLETMLPAPGQGALAIQCRADDDVTRGLLAPLHDSPTADSVSTERSFLSALGGGCSMPIAAYAEKIDEQILLTGAVISPDGKRSIRLTASGTDPKELGQLLARFVLERGGADILGLEQVAI